MTVRFTVRSWGLSVKVLGVSASVCVSDQRAAIKKTDYFARLFLLVLAPTWMFMRFLIIAFIACHRRCCVFKT